MKNIDRKIFLSRYYWHLNNFIEDQKRKNPDNPKRTIRKLLWWNLKQSLKIYSKNHANDYYEPYIDKSCRYISNKKVLFPYEQINKDSNVIIYGINEISRQLIKQNNITKYCRIIGVIDESGMFDTDQLETVPVISHIPDEGGYDRIIIASFDEEVQNRVFDFLRSSFIPLNKAIFKLKEVEVKNQNTIDSRVRICVIVTGGLGDYIIEKRALIELMKMDTNSIFYITSEDLRKKDFLDAIYFDLDNSIITYENENEICYSEYDLIMRLDHVIHILYADINALRVKSKEFYEFTNYWLRAYDHIKELNPRIPYESVIHVNRAKILKLDRYSIMSSYTKLQILDHRVPISIKNEYREQFQALRLPKQYITMNIGADSRPDGRMQVKTWPLEYYNSLIKLIKEKYPQITVVQLGNVNSSKMQGADVYAFGHHLETVKIILKESQLHIDCEGGLVHMATQLGTRCVVLFGPTPAFYYGYEENVNVLPRVCGECMGTTEEWYTHCLYEDEYPARCMKSITPDYVFRYIEKALDDAVMNI